MIESLVLKGDLSGLSSKQKVEYYRIMCKRVGLDPTTQPFKLLNLSGKQVMYCDRSGTQQLNKIHKISHEKLSEKEFHDVFIVSMRAKMPDGRFTDSIGAVNISNKKGDDLANALMKAETKSKRRATLDLLGLGILDESELETIPNVKVIPLVSSVNEILDDSIPDGAIPEQLPKVESQAAAFNQFDPRNEIMNCGKKHNGVEWIKVPDSYLEWMSESASGVNKEKAIATLAFKKQTSDQVPDPLDTAFGKKNEPLVLTPNELTPIEQLQDSLDNVARKGSIEGLEGWAEIHKAELAKLSEGEKAEMRKAYNAAKKQMKGSAK